MHAVSLAYAPCRRSRGGQFQMFVLCSILIEKFSLGEHQIWFGAVLHGHEVLHHWIRLDDRFPFERCHQWGTGLIVEQIHVRCRISNSTNS